VSVSEQQLSDDTVNHGKHKKNQPNGRWIGSRLLYGLAARGVVLSNHSPSSFRSSKIPFYRLEGRCLVVWLLSRALCCYSILENFFSESSFPNSLTLATTSKPYVVGLICLLMSTDTHAEVWLGLWGLRREWRGCGQYLVVGKKVSLLLIYR